MQRYFGINKIDNNLVLSNGDIYHIKKVMRNNILDKVEVVYDNVTYLCEIESLDNFKINILEEIREDKKLDCEIILGVALIKEQKQDLVLQKATELGVDTIVPINMERCVVKLDDKKFFKKKERWQSICKEASEQSKRNTIPKILDIKNINEKIKDIPGVYYLNIHDLLLDDNKELKIEYTMEGLHVNTFGYHFVTKIIKDKIEEIKHEA